MTYTWLLLLLYLFNNFYQINSAQYVLQCWKCETTKDPIRDGTLIDGRFFVLIDRCNSLKELFRLSS